MDNRYWPAVRATRLSVADLLESLTAGEWDAPSLCPGWRVRDVAGHLGLVPRITAWDLIGAAPRGRFNPHRINTVLARREGAHPPEQIVATIRAHAGDRRTAAGLDTRNSLFDVIVHSQDIALPLGRSLAIPPEHSRLGLQRVWEMGWPFRARKRLAGRTLRATDTDWSVGAGPEVRGPALALLLLLTGRDAAATDALDGPGVSTLAPG
jgi:uncharacterized protein (TIGR03083 family)